MELDTKELCERLKENTKKFLGKKVDMTSKPFKSALEYLDLHIIKRYTNITYRGYEDEYKFEKKEGVCSMCGETLAETEYVRYGGVDGKVESQCHFKYDPGYESFYDGHLFDLHLCNKCGDKILKVITNYRD